MATRKLKTVEIYTLIDANPKLVWDDVDNMAATRLIAQFEKHEDIEVVVKDKYGNTFTVFVPYDSVLYLKVTEEDEEYLKPNPYYCEEESSGVVRFVNDFTPCGDGSVVAEFPVPVEITIENAPYPSVNGCQGTASFSYWKDDDDQRLEYPAVITEPKTFHSFFTPIY